MVVTNIGVWSSPDIDFNAVLIKSNNMNHRSAVSENFV